MTTKERLHQVVDELSDEEAVVAEVEADRAAGLPTIPFDEIKRKYG